jgi:hypothetical protein
MLEKKLRVKAQAFRIATKYRLSDPEPPARFGDGRCKVKLEVGKNNYAGTCSLHFISVSLTEDLQAEL